MSEMSGFFSVITWFSLQCTYFGWLDEEDEMVTCSKHEGDEEWVQDYIENQKERDHLAYVGRDCKIVLKSAWD